MEHWIEHPAEPRELILAWQAPSAVEDRFRWAVGRLAEYQQSVIFQYFDEQSFPRYNKGRKFEKLQEMGYDGYPAFAQNKRHVGGSWNYALEAFLRRLPPASRADYSDYLAYFRICPTTQMSPLALLAATEARLPSDGFSLIDPLDPAADCVEVVLEIAGFRYWQNDAPNVKLGDPLELEAEPCNAHDPDAVRFNVRGHAVGYVNRLQAPTVGAWLTSRKLGCWVVRLNGRPEARRAFAFLQVRPAAVTAAAA